MLPSNERLRRKNVFQRAYKERRHVSSPQVSLYVIPRISRSGRSRAGEVGSEADSWRPLVGFVVSKKTARNACQRNRIKRQTREAYRSLSRIVFRGEKNHLRLHRWYALVFVIHPHALISNFDEIYKAVESCLIRAENKFSGKSASSSSSGKQKSIKPKDDQDVNRSRNSSSTLHNNGQLSP